MGPKPSFSRARTVALTRRACTTWCWWAAPLVSPRRGSNPLTAVNICSGQPWAGRFSMCLGMTDDYIYNIVLYIYMYVCIFFLTACRSFARCGSFCLNSLSWCLSIMTNELAEKLICHAYTTLHQISRQSSVIALNANDVSAKGRCDAFAHCRWIYIYI